MKKFTPASIALIAAVLLSPSLAAAKQSAQVPAPLTSAAVSAETVKSLTANFLKTAVKGRIISLSFDGKAYPYRVAYSRFEGNSGEVGLELVSDQSKKATFGIRDGYVSAFIRTPKATYAMGYSNDAPVIGEASTGWTTPSLSELPSINGLRISAKNEKPPAPGATPMSIDTHSLSGMKPGDEASLSLPGLGAVRMVSESSIQGAESSTWQGYLSDFGKTYTATVTWNNDGMTGYIVTPQGDFTIGKTAGGGTYVWNPTALGIMHNENAASCAADVPKAMSTGQLHTPAMARTAATTPTTSQTPVVATTGAATSKTIDILVYYSTGMLTKYGTVAALTTAIDNYVALTNQAYAAAGLTYQMRRVGLKAVNIADTTDNSQLLSQLSNGTAPFNVVSSDRAAVGADLVTVIRPLHASTQNSCGVAWVGGQNNGLAQYSSYKSYMMSVLSDGVDADTGRYYCDQLVLAHETGHNLGLMHDRATVASQGGGTGVTPYAFGYDVPNTWGTIMSYTFPHIVRFSNPNDSTCGTSGKEACGVPDSSANSANSAHALSLTMPLASAFLPAVGMSTPPPTATIYTVNGRVTLNGQPDAGVAINVSPASAASCTTTQADGSFTCSMKSGTSAIELSVAQATAPTGGTISWTPASASVMPNANQSVAFTGAAQTPASTAKATVTLKFTYKNAPVVGTVKLVSGDPSLVSCSTASNVTTCSVAANKYFALSLGYTTPAQKAALCSPSGIAGTLGAGMKYTLGVACM